MLKIIGTSLASHLSQRAAGSDGMGIIPTALLATGANMVVSRKNIPVGLALIGAALLFLEYGRRTDETDPNPVNKSSDAEDALR